MSDLKEIKKIIEDCPWEEFENIIDEDKLSGKLFKWHKYKELKTRINDLKTIKQQLINRCVKVQHLFWIDDTLDVLKQQLKETG